MRTTIANLTKRSPIPRAFAVSVAAALLLMTGSTAFAIGRVIIGSYQGAPAEPVEIVDEGLIYADDLAELGINGVSTVSLHLRIVSDRGRVYEAQIADSSICEPEFDAAGQLTAVTCDLSDD